MNHTCLNPFYLQQICLPKDKHCTLRFMQDIMWGEKRFFLKSQTKHMDVPKWEELSIEKIWYEAMRIVDFRHYIPTDWDSVRKVERAFMFLMLTTLQFDYVEQLIADCRQQRWLNKGLKRARNQVQYNLSSGWAEKLLAHPFESSKLLFFSFLMSFSCRLQGHRQKRAELQPRAAEEAAEVREAQADRPHRQGRRHRGPRAAHVRAGGQRVHTGLQRKQAAKES